MTPADRAAWLRLVAAHHELAAARLRCSAAMVTASESLRQFGEAWVRSEQREVQAHPDLAYLDAQLDAFYAEGP